MIVEKNIVRLNISMSVSFLVNVIESIDNLSEVESGYSLIKVSRILDKEE